MSAKERSQTRWTLYIKGKRNGEKEKNFSALNKNETIVKQEYINEKERRIIILGLEKRDYGKNECCI